jgi:excisionase family DNA binding protein
MHLELLSVQEASLRLKLAPQTIRLWARRGQFRWFKLGGRMVIDSADLEQFILAHARPRQAPETLELGSAPREEP